MFPKIGKTLRQSQIRHHPVVSIYKNHQSRSKNKNTRRQKFILMRNASNTPSFLCCVCRLKPHIPAVNTHERIVNINNQITIHLPSRQQIHIQPGGNDPRGINPDILLFGKPNTQNTESSCYKFQPDVNERSVPIRIKKKIND